MGLASLAGFRDVDVFGGKTVVGWLNERDGKRRAASVEQQTEQHFAELMAQQKIEDKANRQAMLERVRQRQQAAINEPYGERRNRLLDKWEEAVLLLTEKIDG